ncbi:MAG: hypothetical protein LBH52_01390, partial [Puniceicoccales bacterium]|nr:hypothetical protein [Puniceicoccales bacterium]
NPGHPKIFKHPDACLKIHPERTSINSQTHTRTDKAAPENPLKALQLTTLDCEPLGIFEYPNTVVRGKTSASAGVRSSKLEVLRSSPLS